MMFVAEKNSIWYSTMPKGILFMGNGLSFDPGLFDAMHRENLWIKLFCHYLAISSLHALQVLQSLQDWSLFHFVMPVPERQD